MLFIFKKKSILVCLVAKILDLIDSKVLIVSPDESYFFKTLTKLGIKLHCEPLLYLDMSLPNIKDHGVIDGDLNKDSDSCAENLYKRIDPAKDLESFFPNIKYLEKKLKVFVYQHYNKIFTPQQLIITWVKSSIYKNDIIVNFLSLKPGTKSIWRSSNLRIIFIFGYLNFFIGIIGKILFVITKNLTSMIFVKFIKKKNIVKSNRFNQVENFHQDGVLFFPHNGVVTTGQPPSDHFYSSELNSPFHPSKIMHLEYDYRVNIEY